MSQKEIDRDGDDKNYMADVEKLLHLLHDRYKKYDTTMTQEETNLLEEKLGLKFPVAVRQFLYLLGNDYHTIFGGNDDSMEYAEEMQMMPSEISEEHTDVAGDIPKDVFVLDTYSGQNFTFMYRHDMSVMDDPPLYRWGLTYWDREVDEGGRGIKRLSNHFSEFVNREARWRLERN